MGKHERCVECGAAVSAGAPMKQTRVGRYEVIDDSKSGPVCENGHAEIDLMTLAGYEHRAAEKVLGAAANVNGDEIRFARKALGLTQARLAAFLDVAPETVSRWETGAEVMSRVSRLALLAVVRDVTAVERIADGEGARPGTVLKVGGRWRVS